MKIGKLTETGTDYYFCKGIIDEVRLYNRAITAAEVGQLYLARGT